jgi:hypothetical protein
MPTISPTTGESYYSGEWDTNIKPLVKALKVGGGRLNTVDAAVLQRYQEQVDRLIDNQLMSLYVTPLVKMRIYNRTEDVFVLTYPGRVQEAARYWVAGLLLKSEYQQLDANVNEAVQNYIDYALTLVEQCKSMTDRLEGQRWRADVSRFLPPGAIPMTRPDYPSSI